MQIVIQLQKFAEAVKRIKGAVGSVNDRTPPPAAAAAAGKSAYSSDSVFGRDLSGMLSTDLTGIDPSLGGQLMSPTGKPCTDHLYHVSIAKGTCTAWQHLQGVLRSDSFCSAVPLALYAASGSHITCGHLSDVRGGQLHAVAVTSCDAA